MAKRWNKALAFALALCMCVGSMNVSAWATTTETVDVPAKPGGEEIEVEIAIEKEGDSLKVEGEAKKDGIEVEVEGEFETKPTENGETELVNGSATFEAESSDGTYEAEGGYEIKTEEKAPEVEVDVSLKEGGEDSKSTESKSEELEIPDAPEYDESATSVTGGKVTVKTEEVGMENFVPKDENGNPIADNMVYYQNEVKVDYPDLPMRENFASDAEYLEAVKKYNTEVEQINAQRDLGEDLMSSMNNNVSDNEADKDGFVFDVGEGYEFVYVGTENSSTYFPVPVFEKPLTKEELKAAVAKKEAEVMAVYLKNNGYDRAKELTDQFMKKNNCYEDTSFVGPDGKTTYYLHRVDKKVTDGSGWYEDGKWYYKDSNSNQEFERSDLYSSVHQFTMVDAQGNKVTAYCADQTTTAKDGYNYNVENLEDATYYSETEAAMIRTIAENGYWGQTEGKGSLAAVKAMMADAKDKDGKAIFSQDEINQLTDGMAMTATQCAIWNFSNDMQGVKFVDMYHLSDLGELNSDGEHYTNYRQLFGSDTTDAKSDTALILKLYEHLIHMEPTREPENPSTANTVITKKNFLKDISLSVLEKAEGHVNNQDDNKDNDAYVTELTFSLVVEPSEENKDDMIVTILAGGQEYKCRLAGDDSNDGDDFVPLAYNSETKNYILSGITLTEGDVNFNITLEGIQNLQEGVYLYTSEVRTVDGEEESSQTFVGRGSGQRAVGVSMNLKFDLDVQDEIVVTERQWREESYYELPDYPEYDPEEYDDDVDIPEDPVPLSDLVDIFDEEIPLASVPQTGVNNTPWSLMIAAAGLALAAVLGKKNK